MCSRKKKKKTCLIKKKQKKLPDRDHCKWDKYFTEAASSTDPILSWNKSQKRELGPVFIICKICPLIYLRTADLDTLYFGISR